MDLQETTLAIPVRHTIFLPLAITAEDEKWGCVAGVEPDGTWLRPSPIPSSWTRDPAGPFRYQVWSELSVAPHQTSDRLEDRLICGIPVFGRSIDSGEFRDLLNATTDPDVAAAFAGRRSAALIRSRVEAIYARRHTRGRTFLHIIFCDVSGERFDWVVPEVATIRALASHIHDATLSPDHAKTWLDEMEASDVFLAIGLTLPNERTSGRFGGCQPLVVGVHRLSPLPVNGRESAEG